MATRPHILLDLLAFDPADGGFTAACRALVEICSNVRGLDFTVVTSGAHAPEFRESRLPLLTYTFPRSLRYGINALILPIIARSRHFSAVHSEMSAISPLVPFPSSMTLHDLAFVGNRQAHNTGLGGTLMHLYWNKYYLMALARADRVRCISRATAADLRTFSGRESGVNVIYPFFHDRHHAYDHRFCVDDVLRIVFLGTILPRKNLSFLLEAVSQLSRPWELHLVGNIAWGSEVLDRYKAHRNIITHGFVSNAERDAIVSRSDVMILPSLAEGFGYPPLEAAALGTPSLLSDIPVFREIAPADALFSLADPRALAARLENLDVAALIALAAAWRQAVAEFSFERAVVANTDYFVELAEARYDRRT